MPVKGGRSSGRGGGAVAYFAFGAGKPSIGAAFSPKRLTISAGLRTPPPAPPRNGEERKPRPFSPSPFRGGGRGEGFRIPETRDGPGYAEAGPANDRVL